MQFFLRSNPLKKSRLTIKPLYPVCPASHRGAQCIGPRLLTNPALPRARRLASLLMRPLITRRLRSSGSKEPPYHSVRRWCSGWRGFVMASRNSSKPRRQPLARATLQSDPGRKTDQSASATREPGSVLLLSYAVDFDRHLEIENGAVIRAIAD